MKMLSAIFAITFTICSSAMVAQNKFVNNGAAANNVKLSDVKFEKNVNGAVINWQARTNATPASLSCRSAMTINLLKRSKP